MTRQMRRQRVNNNGNSLFFIKRTRKELIS
jgi:hypothetical protein